MIINCIWEHNGNDTLLYAVDYVGAYTRGENLDIAKAKMPAEISSYLKWCGGNAVEDYENSVELNSEEKDLIKRNVNMSLSKDFAEAILKSYADEYKIRVKYKLMGLTDL